jgi:hypothetical protein
MEFTIPLKDVKIEVVSSKKEIQYPVFTDSVYSITQNEFSMNVDKVAWFYVSGGDYISIFPYPGADEKSIGLYLNGSVYGAILHQRKVLPLHGSSFNYNSKNILICGESGTGKSSVTASFCLNGAEFLSDDITPVIFKNRQPCIWAMSDRIKLWSDSLKQLKQAEEKLQRIYPEYDKFYYNIDQGKNTLFPLSLILIIEIHDSVDVKFRELSGSEKFEALRNEIYRHEYLQGMNENEKSYFRQLIDISEKTKITTVFRPSEIKIDQFRLELIKSLALNP